MSSRVYEGMFLLDSNRYSRDPSGVSGQISEIVESSGGEMLASRMWSEQKLAYPINGHRKGTYWLTYFRLDSDKQTELNRKCQLNNNIMRNLVLVVDDRLVDTLVSHAVGGGKTEAKTETKTVAKTEVAAAATEETPAADPPAEGGDAKPAAE